MRWFTGLGPERRRPVRFAIAVLGLLAIVCLAAATLRVSGASVGYPFLALLVFLPYGAAIALVCCLGGAVLRSPLVAAVGLAALLLIGAAVLPRLNPNRESDASGPTIQVLSLNLGLGGADSREVARLLTRDELDVVSLQELTPEAVERLGDAGVGDGFPGQVLLPAPGADGEGLLAAEPLREVPDPGIYPDPMPQATMRLGDETITLTAVHPKPPVNSGYASSWAETLERLPSEPDDAQGLLIGDFNATLDLPQLRDVINRGYVDAADYTGDGLAPTFPTQGSHVPGIVIDHILAPAGSHISGYRAIRVAGTDHRAIVASVTLPGD